MTPRPVTLGVLALTSALGTVGGCLGISALALGIADKNKVKDRAPPGVSVDINTDDIISCGAVLTVGCGLVALVSFISSIILLFRSTSYARKRVLLASLLAFFSFWVLVTAIATLALTKTRSAKVTAMLGSTKLPEALVKAAEKAAGVHRVYWENWYLRAASIMPYPVFIFGFLSSIAVHTTRTKEQPTTQVYHGDAPDTKAVDNGVMLERTTTKEAHGHHV